MPSEKVDISDKSMKSFAQLFRESNLTGDRATFLGVTTSLVKNFDQLTGNVGNFFKESLKAKFLGKTREEKDGSKERTGFIENMLTGNLFKNVEKAVGRDVEDVKQATASDIPLDEMTDNLSESILKSFGESSIIIKRLDDVRLILQEILGSDKIVEQIDHLLDAIVAETGQDKELVAKEFTDEFAGTIEGLFDGKITDVNVLNDIHKTLSDSLNFARADAKEAKRTKLENAREAKKKSVGMFGASGGDLGKDGGGLFGTNLLDLNLLSLAGLTAAGVVGTIVKGIGVTGILGALAVSLGVTFIDTIKGMDMAEEIGVSKLAGAVAGIFAGTGDGLMAAFVNTGKWAAMGAAAGLFAGPVGVLIGGVIGAAIGAIASWVGYENMAKGVDGLLKWGSNAIKTVSDVAKFIGDSWNAIPENLENLKNKIATFITETWASIPTIIEDMKSRFVGMVGDITGNVLGIVGNMKTAVGNFVREQIEGAPDSIKKLGTDLASLFGDVWKSYSDAVFNLVDGIGGLLGITDGKIDPVVFKALVDNILTIPVKLIAIFTDIFDNVVETVKQSFTDFVDMLKKNLSWDGISKRAGEATEGMVGWVGGLFGGGEEVVQDTLKELTDVNTPTLSDNVDASQAGQANTLEEIIRDAKPPAPAMSPMQLQSFNSVNTNNFTSIQLRADPFESDPTSSTISQGLLTIRP